MKLPARFGKYELLERIAAGGMAEVFLARSFGVEGFERRLVIKRILPGLAGSARFVSMFVSEAKISAMLSHPNIVQIYDLGREGEDYYIAMEHIAGRDLTRIWRRNHAQGRRMPLGLAVSIAASAARALAYAHGRTDSEGAPLQIVHRDVSPHNVIVSYQGEVKLVDFGIARLVPEGGVEDPDAPGGGKFAYMSPEQAGGEPVDHRSDLFSLGVVLYELVTNQRLFDGADLGEKLRRVRGAEVPDPQVVDPTLPPRLCALLRRLLSHDPADRPQSAEALEEELRAVLYQLGERGDAAALGELMRTLFADELRPDPAAARLRGLALDLERLDHRPSVGATPAATPSPSGGDRGEVGERRAVILAAVEVMGLTDLAETLDPEEHARREQALIAGVRAVIHRYGGRLEGETTDTLTAIFGDEAPQDALDRALAAAWDLQEDGVASGRLHPGTQLAVGVARGEIAMIASADGPRRLVHAGPLKLARRIATSVEPGQIGLNEELGRAAADRWRVEPGPPMRRGHDEGRVALLCGRRRVSLAGPGSRWVRRGDELERLASAMEALAEGRGGVVALLGATGSGKSRLTREVRGLAERAEVAFFVGRAASSQGGGPLCSLRDLVMSVCTVEEQGISPLAVSRARAERLGALGLPKSDARELAALLSADEDEPRAGRDAWVSGMARLVRALSHERPAIFVLEDLHRVSAVEREVITELCAATAGCRALWILTARPMETPPGSPRGANDEGLGLPERAARVVLGALSDSARLALIADLLGARSVSAGLFTLIDRAAEGNPLYMVELVRTLGERSLIRVEDGLARLRDPAVQVSLPPGLEGLIAARFDQLHPEARSALRLAAAIGPSFPAALLRAALALEVSDGPIQELLDAGLLHPLSDGGLGFVSELVWEVARRTTLTAQRRVNHHLIADAIERVYADRLHEWSETLAEQHALAGRLHDAARFAERAGDHLRRGAFLERALEQYRKGLAFCLAVEEEGGGGRGQGRPLELEAGLRLKAGEVALTLGDESAERDLQIAQDIASDLGLSELELGSGLALGRLYAARGDVVLARAHLELGLNSAQALGLPELEVELLEALGELACDQGDWVEADRALTAALRLAGDDAQLAAMSCLGLGDRYARAGDTERAMELLLRARAEAERAGDRLLLGRVVNALGLTTHAAERYDESLALFREALALRGGTGQRVSVIVNLYNIGEALVRLGDAPRAWAAFNRAKEQAVEQGAHRLAALGELWLGYLAAARGDEAGEARLSDATVALSRLNDPQSALTGRWLAGRLHRERGDHPQAQTLLRAALSDAEALGATLLARDIQRELAQLPAHNAKKS
ncbi:MAG: protein kinase [Deltaproteobacteria bacterium]|nr:protein kinase [Deltaproteobacteria bacterium]